MGALEIYNDICNSFVNFQLKKSTFFKWTKNDSDQLSDQGLDPFKHPLRLSVSSFGPMEFVLDLFVDNSFWQSRGVACYCACVVSYLVKVFKPVSNSDLFTSLITQHTTYKKRVNITSGLRRKPKKSNKNWRFVQENQTENNNITDDTLQYNIKWLLLYQLNYSQLVQQISKYQNMVYKFYQLIILFV
ncbi:Hypothetical_protein [Hexamita inflata]|uniref:Hypothetical_protein n=1 Tax=Hexamita inflata TaxID=28002 RepID=A0AA86RMN5_9EUKA|nr:Hypothetical protein HINF_LOCUS56875 [Hexamita inflata]